MLDSFINLIFQKLCNLGELYRFWQYSFVSARPRHLSSQAYWCQLPGIRDRFTSIFVTHKVQFPAFKETADRKE
jgi:hypothetical protein